MHNDQLQALNAQFGLDSQLRFEIGAGELVFAQIHNDHASASIALQGAHVLSYQPHGQQPILWVSRQSSYTSGKAIRGGIPVCWPWFGPHPSNPTLPSHGFARTTEWQVVGAESLADGATELRLELSDNERTRVLWPHAFRLTMAVTVGRELHVELESHNPGDASFTYSGALHSYFQISDIANISIDGLDGASYIDQLQGNERQVQRGVITINDEVDRIYQQTEATCTIHDPGLQRRVVVAKEGSSSTVVWNPWIAKAQRMADFGDNEYRGMVCIETANAGDDVITIAPGSSYHLRARISVASNSD